MARYLSLQTALLVCDIYRYGVIDTSNILRVVDSRIDRAIC